MDAESGLIKKRVPVGKRWSLLFLLSILLASVVLYFVLNPKLWQRDESWTSEELEGDMPEVQLETLGHGPVVHEKAGSDGGNGTRVRDGEGRNRRRM